MTWRATELIDSSDGTTAQAVVPPQFCYAFLPGVPSTALNTQPAEEEITRLLQRLRAGDQSAADRLLPMVYDQLHKLAAIYLSRERVNHTLQPTALINEAFIKLLGYSSVPSANRIQFFAIAAHVMRQVLVDYARSRHAEKRGSDRQPIPLDQVILVSEEQSLQLLVLDEALQRLSKLSPRQVRIIELRFFAGLSVVETAEVLEVSPRTIVREWRIAQAWLRRELKA